MLMHHRRFEPKGPHSGCPPQRQAFRTPRLAHGCTTGRTVNRRTAALEREHDMLCLRVAELEKKVRDHEQVHATLIQQIAFQQRSQPGNGRRVRAS